MADLSQLYPKPSLKEQYGLKDAPLLEDMVPKQPLIVQLLTLKEIKK